MARSTSGTAGEKDILHARLDATREALLWKLDGLSEADRRRPMTRSGTNLLGLVKHLIGVEYNYLGETFDRTPDEKLPWVEDGSFRENGDMWARPDETTDYIVELYRRVCANSDRTIHELDLDDIGTEPFPGGQPKSLRDRIIGLILDTARHAGHADIIRELIDGSTGYDSDDAGIHPSDEAWWQEYVARVEAAAREADGG
ncbi:DinB family protein [Actinopolymorpha sp. B9G3]|uniref:DinB family protein n=1 Tax=Actinopolymorpha sp. B9G3 TaxID=3158970 RepID=UPI0032D98CB3